MNAKFKSVLIVVLTLAIGGLLGAVATGTAMSSRVDQLNKLRTSQGFAETMERVVEPTDAGQRETIRLILDDGAERLAELGRKHRAERSAMVDSIRTELNEVITTEQRLRVDEWIERHRSKRGKHGHQPGTPAPQRQQ
jgi:hypothetical protein